jgi:beta-barrel assembly-enhancing protease
MTLKNTLFRFALPMLLCIAFTSKAELPVLGDPTQQAFSPADETLMGKKFYLTLKANLNFINDLEINSYINTLGKKLISHSDNPDKKFRFFILNINNINAFAGPDAYLGFNTGLIIAAKNESEFAGVMAHEISHVTQRHLARAMTETNASPATMFATILAGIIVASKNPEAGAAIIYGSQAVAMQSQINFTRTNEYEADRIGINILKDAGINPIGMAGFFETLLQNSEPNSFVSNMEYLRTHPLSTTRVAEARNRISSADTKLPDDSLDFQLMRARVLVKTNNFPDKIIQQIYKMDKPKRNIVTDYTLGLAYTANNQSNKAINLLSKLAQSNTHPWIKLALSDAYHEQRQSNNALNILQQLNTIYPDYPPISVRLARTFIDNKQPVKAINLLNQQLRIHKLAPIYSTLAKSYFANNQTTLALEATSYEYEIEGQIKQAAQQINNALQQPNLKPLTIQRLESRRKNLLSQIHKEASTDK